MSKKNTPVSGIGSGASRYTVTAPGEGTQNKLPIDIARGKKEDKGYYHIPCHLLHEFTMKKEYDFSPWPEEKFTELVESIQKYGVITPVIVRNSNTAPGQYEVMAGEHRLKACMKLGLDTIPARIEEDCDDDKAKVIFTLTNILRRDLTIKDSVFGWSQYYMLTKGKTQETITEMKSQGLIDAAEMSKRNIFRYYKISKLHPQLRELFFRGKLPLPCGEQLGNLSPEEQEDLTAFSERLTPAKLKIVMALHNGEIEGHGFDLDSLDFIFSDLADAPKKMTLALATAQAKPVIKEKIKKEDYERAGEIVGNALDMYYKYQDKEKDIEIALKQYYASKA